MRLRTTILALFAVALVAAAVPLSGRSWTSVLESVRGGVSGLMSGLSAANTPISKGSGGGAPQQGPPPNVTVSQPAVRPIVEWDEFAGRFDAVDSVEIRARVFGYLTAVHFKDGQHVEKGDLLFEIDPRPFERAVALARAELSQAQVKVENARLDVDRAKPLLERRVVSEKAYDDRANILRDAEAAVKVFEARLQSAELDLSYARITAPVSGRIGRSIVTVGNLVSGGGANTTTTLTTIVSQDPIYLYFDVSENDAIKYRRLAGIDGRDSTGVLGASVEIALNGDPSYPHKGVVDFVDNRLDASTGTLRLRARVENKDGLFKPGMFARVRVQASPRYDAVLLPDAAIGADQASRYALVVGDDQVPQRRAVKLGPLFEGLRVVREGVSGDDWVIVNGLARIRPGQKVTPRREQLKVSETERSAPRGMLVKQ
jgi:multidrug efflux system membrane fusion protein